MLRVIAQRWPVLSSRFLCLSRAPRETSCCFVTVAVTAASPSALLFAPSDIAGMLLKSTGSFLESGLQESCAELWTSADDNGAADELRLASHWLSLCFLLWESYFPVGFQRSLFILDCDGPGVGLNTGREGY